MVVTDMGGHGGCPVQEGALGIVWASTLPDNGPSGGFFFDGEACPMVSKSLGVELYRFLLNKYNVFSQPDMQNHNFSDKIFLPVCVKLVS